MSCVIEIKDMSSKSYHADAAWPIVNNRLNIKMGEVVIDRIGDTLGALASNTE